MIIYNYQLKINKNLTNKLKIKKKNFKWNIFLNIKYKTQIFYNLITI